MRFEQAGNAALPKVGFGTWRIGGGLTPDLHQDAVSLAALRSALEIGYRHVDTAERYAGGHCEELIGRVLRETRTPRETVFLTSKVSPEHLIPTHVTKACESSLRRLGTEYLDLYLIHWPNPQIPLGETFTALNQLAAAGKVRHLGVSNFDLTQLRHAYALADGGILTNQVPMSLDETTYVDNGVLAFCQANDILLTAYSPIKHVTVTRNKHLAQIAAAHSATPHQVALAWLTNQSHVITIPMSVDSLHQRQNFEAGDLILEQDEMRRLA